MPLPLPILDDRRWTDLVDEARALIPFYAPEWTDHNVHDPGITLLELYAWLAEMDIFRLDRIPAEHRLRFLALAGVRPKPPRAARTVLAFHLGGARTWLRLPAGLVFEGDDEFGAPTPFRTTEALTLVASTLTAVQVYDGRRFDDLTRRWQLGEPVPVFGDDPRPGAALYLGFIAGLPPTRTVTIGRSRPFRRRPVPGRHARRLRITFPATLQLVFDDLPTSDAERERILDELAADRAACAPGTGLLDCGPKPTMPAASPAAGRPTASGSDEADLDPLAHHAARIVWEVMDAHGEWQALDVAAREVHDETRAFTLSGCVVLRVPAAMAQATIGAVDAPLYYLRCRFAGGAFDRAPRLRALALNAVRAEQAVPPPGAASLGGDPTAWGLMVGHGTGLPEQFVELPGAPVVESSVGVHAVEPPATEARAWERQDDFDASGRRDAHFVLDPSTGRVTFGDGEHGRVVPKPGAGAPEVAIWASYLTTRAGEGNLAGGTTMKLSAVAANDVALATVGRKSRTIRRLERRGLLGASTLVDAAGGAAAESLVHAEGRALELVDPVEQAVTLKDCRALELVDGIERAVTLKDYRELALRTPGARLARAHALANVHTALPCFRATGVVTVVIVPHLPEGRPVPSPGLRRWVAACLSRRRVIGTRVNVVGPVYRKIGVRATVRAHVGASVTSVRRKVVEALAEFFHPLEGGPEGAGWPFGRDVFRSEVLQVIDEVPGVDHVLDLELVADGGEPQCADVCLGPIGLTTSGEHVVDVLRGER